MSKNRSKLYRGYQTVIPSNIRNKLKISLDDELEWSIKEDYIKIRIIKQKPLDEYEDFLI